MSRRRYGYEDENEERDFVENYERGIERGGASTIVRGTRNKNNHNNAMDALSEELDGLTRLLDKGTSLQDYLVPADQKISEARDPLGDAPLPVEPSNHPPPSSSSWTSLQFSSVDSAANSEEGGPFHQKDDSFWNTGRTLDTHLREESSFVTPSEPVKKQPQQTTDPKCTSYSSAASRPPVNVQSPPFRLFSPPMDTTTTSPRRTTMEQATTANNNIDNNNPRTRLFENYTPEQEGGLRRGSPARTSQESSWQPILLTMKETLEQKDERIKILEEENASLRSQLERFKRMVPQSHNHQKDTPPNNQSNTRRYKPTTQHNEERIFSPGTQFVAELAQMMDIEVGHYAPLSYILDKHWDKLSTSDDKEP